MSNTPIFKFALREDLKNDKQFLPTRAELKATGWDVRAAFKDRKSLFIQPFQKIMIPLGIRSFCPEGWWYDLKPRSSTFAKKELHSLYGTIDETYEGELIFACQYIPTLTYDEKWDDVDDLNDGKSIWFEPESWEEYCAANILKIDFGDAIAQIIPRLREEMVVEEVTNQEYDKVCKDRSSIRGTGGFGSTGR